MKNYKAEFCYRSTDECCLNDEREDDKDND